MRCLAASLALFFILSAPWCCSADVHHRTRRLLQAQTQASAASMENLSGQTTNQVANASASASATSYSSLPLPTTSQCIQFSNTNYNGELLYFVSGVANPGICCDLCSRQSGCNVYVYCPQLQGCDDGSGRIYPGNLCTLKYQRLNAGTGPTSYGAGPNVPWTSGIVTQSSLGYCVGYAEAAASAQATAGCGSVAYAVAVATAVDSCGNTAAAQALSVAVGGTCPVTCEAAVDSVRNAAKSNGCGSPQYIDAVNTASALCGASRYAQLSQGICPAPECGSAVATAAASASAACDTIAYASALATAQTACGSAFASAAASAIGNKCPIDCAAAVQAAASAASSTGCKSTAFASAQATAVLICGADSYSAQAATVSGGICGIGDTPATDDIAPPATEPITRPAGPVPTPEQPIIVFPTPPSPTAEPTVVLPVLIPGSNRTGGGSPTVEPIPVLVLTPSAELVVPSQPIVPGVIGPAAENVQPIRPGRVVTPAAETALPAIVVPVTALPPRQEAIVTPALPVAIVGGGTSAAAAPTGEVVGQTEPAEGVVRAPRPTITPTAPARAETAAGAATGASAAVSIVLRGPSSE